MAFRFKTSFATLIVASFVWSSFAEEDNATILFSSFELGNSTAIPLPPELAKYDDEDASQNQLSPFRSATTTGSFEMARKAPLGDLTDLNWFAGYYEFDEGAVDDEEAMGADENVALTSAFHVESAYFEDRDLDMAEGFIGLWGALPLGGRDEEKERKTVRTFFNAMTPPLLSPNRIRTRKEPSGEPLDPIAYEPILVASYPEVSVAVEEQEGRSEKIVARVLQRRFEDPAPQEAKPAEPEKTGFMRKLTRRFIPGNLRR